MARVYYQQELDFNPPTTDKEFYLRYQEEYRAGNTKKLDDIYKLVFKIAKAMILTEIQKKCFYLCNEDIEIKAYNCASYIVEQLIKKADFEIKEIGGYVYLRVKHELYYRTKLDDLLKNVSNIKPKKYFKS